MVTGADLSTRHRSRRSWHAATATAIPAARIAAFIRADIEIDKAGSLGIKAT